MEKLKPIVYKVNKLLKKAVNKGLLDIITSSILNKVLVLISTVSVIRLMSPNDFGIFSYAYNIITMINIVSSLGCDVAMLQFCCEDRPRYERLGILKFSIIFSTFVNFIFSIAIFAYACFGELSLPEGRFALMSFAFILPFTCILNCQKYWLRINKDNKEFGILMNISSFTYLIFSVVLILFFGLAGSIIGRYIGFILPSIFGFYYIKKYIQEVVEVNFPTKEVLYELVKYGFTIALTNGISEMLYYLDVYVVGLITSNSLSIAYYKGATVIPRALSSLPAIIMVFVYPYFAFNKDRYIWVKNHVKLMQLCMFPSSILIAIIFIVFAPWIITILYGEDYLEALLPFRILVFSFVFAATFRTISGNILAMLGRVKENLYMGIIECTLNIVLDYYLILNYGSIGAAIATLLITIISSIMCTGYLYWYLNINIKLSKNN